MERVDWTFLLGSLVPLATLWVQSRLAGAEAEKARRFDERQRRWEFQKDVESAAIVAVRVIENKLASLADLSKPFSPATDILDTTIADVDRLNLVAAETVADAAQAYMNQVAATFSEITAERTILRTLEDKKQYVEAVAAEPSAELLLDFGHGRRFSGRRDQALLWIEARIQAQIKRVIDAWTRLAKPRSQAASKLQMALRNDLGFPAYDEDRVARRMIESEELQRDIMRRFEAQMEELTNRISNDRDGTD